MKVYAIIMAGGKGARFWPLSRKFHPKQLLNLSGNDILIRETITRISKIIDPGDIFIITNSSISEIIKEVTSGIICSEHIFVEPKSCDTAACIGYAACVLVNRYKDGVMCIFPSDHYIDNEEEFIRVIKLAIDYAVEHEALVTIGIPPAFPSTGYGYIKYINNSNSEIRKVIEFIEKPDFNTSLYLFSSGDYLWNSGIFVWKASTILNCFKRYQPYMYTLFERILKSMDTSLEHETIKDVYKSIKCISIDKCILEHSDEVYVIPSDFRLNDIGSWDMLYTIHNTDKDGNISFGDTLKIDTKNSIIYSDKRLVATLGANNLIIVETDDVILVCDKSRTQDIKSIVIELERMGRIDLL